MLNNDYNPQNIEKKKMILQSLQKNLFLSGKKLSRYLRGIFPYVDGFKVKKESDEESDENEEIDTTDIPDLESEESAAERRKQKASGLKILTPNQMVSRLPISLAQLKAGNNCEKLKNEIRQ